MSKELLDIAGGTVYHVMGATKEIQHLINKQYSMKKPKSTVTSKP